MALHTENREVTKAEVRVAISSVDTLIQWAVSSGPAFQECVTCGTPTFESTVVDAARDASQFFKDLLL